MWPDIIVIVAPERQRSACIGQAVEDFLVEAFAPQAAIERLNVTVLLWLSRIDVAPLDLVVV